MRSLARTRWRLRTLSLMIALEASSVPPETPTRSLRMDIDDCSAASFSTGSASVGAELFFMFAVICVMRSSVFDAASASSEACDSPSSVVSDVMATTASSASAWLSKVFADASCVSSTVAMSSSDLFCADATDADRLSSSEEFTEAATDALTAMLWYTLSTLLVSTASSESSTESSAASASCSATRTFSSTSAAAPRTSWTSSVHTMMKSFALVPWGSRMPESLFDAPLPGFRICRCVRSKIAAASRAGAAVKLTFVAMEPNTYASGRSSGSSTHDDAVRVNESTRTVPLRGATSRVPDVGGALTCIITST
mmetsp:Transcript_34292/g.108111  ORF Transcript_34292/g.108111 Transcript_34292/m.108111 type:complete len:311 (-) Transcript_34292:405-1337(-)